MSVAAHLAADWWAERLLDESRRADFRATLIPIFERELQEAAAEPGFEGSVDLGYVDYDPSEPLIEALAVVGIPCKGSLFSARNIFAAEKAGVKYQSGALVAKAGYAEPWLPLVACPRA